MSTTKKSAREPEDLQTIMQKFIAQGRKDGMIRATDLAAQLEKAGSRTAYEQVMAAVSDFEKGNMRLSMVLASIDVK